jgi:hypothetical protein
MVGATEYYRIIKEAHSNKLGGLEKTRLGYVNHGGDAQCYRWNNALFVTASHARGETFFIYLIGDNDELFEVYGITGGQRGWTETYGWLRKGTWTRVILAYLRVLKRDTTTHKENLVEAERKKQAERNRPIAEKVAKFNAMFREVPLIDA